MPAVDAVEPAAAQPWRDVDGLEHALGGGSLLVLGAPGVGKSFWCRELVQRLRASGRRVDIIAKCHASCQNFGEGAVTADHWVRRYVRAGRCCCQTLVVEEVSQISCYLWNDTPCWIPGVAPRWWMGRWSGRGCSGSWPAGRA